MRQIKIKSIKLRYFKGIVEKTINFSDLTIISGSNRQGKTTIFDAFLWLFFGKDSSGKSDFNIKTLDENNNPLPQLEHSVEAEMIIDGQVSNFKKVYKEKWTKKKNSPIPEMTGHTTDYYVNDVPFNESQYIERVEAIMPENLFKMITSPTYFNSMKWEQRRGIITEIAGALSDMEIAGDNMDYILLLEQLNGKTLDEYKRELASKIKKVKEDMELIPTRVDEAMIAMPETYDYGQLEQDIEALELELKKLDDQKQSIVAANDEKNKKIQEIVDGKFELQKQLMQLKNANKLKALKDENPYNIEVKQLGEKYDANSNLLNTKQSRLESLNASLQNLIKINDEAREKWGKINAEQFILVDAPTHCNTCKQPLPDDQLEQYKLDAQDRFNADKQTRLNTIQQQGIGRKKEIEQTQTAIDIIKKEIEELNEIMEPLGIELQAKQDLQSSWFPKPIETDPKEKELEDEINSIVIPKQVIVEDPTIEQRKPIRAQIDALKAKLSTREQITKVNDRIAELEEQQKDLATQLGNLERAEYIRDQFMRLKMKSIEGKVNDKFKFVKWKLFNIMINGNAEDCCDCLVNGVPFPDVNTAGKINAGLDIINTLTQHYNVTAPVWIDNCESINEVTPIAGQQILLYVTAPGTELKIS